MSVSERNVEGMKEECLSDRNVSGGSTTGPFDAWRERTYHGMGPSR